MAEAHGLYHESKTLEQTEFPWEDDTFSLSLNTFYPAKKINQSSPLKKQWNSDKESGRVPKKPINSIEHITPLSSIPSMDTNRSPSILSRQTDSSIQSSVRSNESWKIAHSTQSISSLPTVRSIQIPKNSDQLILFDEDNNSTYSFRHYFDPTYEKKKKKKKNKKNSVFVKFIKNLKQIFHHK